tara:strand:- start:63 stop:230 length:168 start_codon:yes stop_codon:yes gene_type:complete
MASRQWFWIRYVNPGTTNLSSIQAFEKSVVIYEGASSCIYYEDSFKHVADQISIY